MYRKKYLGLKFTPSTNKKTRQREEARFKRYCNRIFKIRKLGAPSSLETQLIKAKRSRFLFLESQFIDKPISHLKYSRKSLLPDAQDYKFLTPIFSFNRGTRERITQYAKVLLLQLMILHLQARLIRPVRT